MNFLGMGTFEILIVLLLAFLLLGPERMIGVARNIGKVVGEVRRATSEIPDFSTMMEEDKKDPSPEVIEVHEELTSNFTPLNIRLADAEERSAMTTNEPADPFLGNYNPVPFQKGHTNPDSDDATSTQDTT